MFAGGSDDASTMPNFDMKPRGFIARHPLVSLLAIAAAGYLSFKGMAAFLVP